MADELKTIKFQLMLSQPEADAIDDWGFKNRIRSRAEAIRRLCQMGLAVDALTEGLEKTALDAGKYYSSVVNKLTNILEDTSISTEEKARLSVPVATDLLNPIAALTLRAAEVVQLTKPYRTSEDLQNADQKVSEFRKIMADVAAKQDESKLTD